MPGSNTSEAEIHLVSAQGFWLLLDDEELYLPYQRFPWFKTATIEQLMSVQRPQPNHLYWPLLDVDLTVESIRNPDAFPLIAKH